MELPMPIMALSPKKLHRCAKSPLIFTSGIWCQRHYRHRQFHYGSHLRLDLTHDYQFNQTQLFFDLIRLNYISIFLDFKKNIRLNSFSISLDSIVFSFDQTQLFSIRVTQFESHSSQASGIPTLARVSSKYENTETVEYSTILIIEIVFGENILTKSNKLQK